VLSELSAFEAKYLDQVAAGYDIDFQVLPSTQAAARYQSLVGEAIASRSESMKGEQQTVPGRTRSYAQATIGYVYGLSVDFFCKPIAVSVPFEDETGVETYATLGAHATTAYLLQRQDLLKIESVEVPSARGVLRIQLACLTPLGADFVVACIGRDV
jgi:hypothetical protein